MVGKHKKDRSHIVFFALIYLFGILGWAANAWLYTSSDMLEKRPELVQGLYMARFMR